MALQRSSATAHGSRSTRAFGAKSFEEEKRFIFERAACLSQTNWGEQQPQEKWAMMQDFPGEFGRASAEARGDAETVLAAVTASPGVLRSASEALRGDRAFVREVLRRDALALEHASEALRGDAELVMQAVRDNGAALEFASESLRGEKSVVLAAVQTCPLSLKRASEAMRADFDCAVSAILHEQGSAWNLYDLLDSIGSELKGDKDFFLAAVRSMQGSEHNEYKWVIDFFRTQADKSLMQALSPEELEVVAVGTALAHRGEAAPIVSVTLSRVETDDGEGSCLGSDFDCSVVLLSGNGFTCRVANGTDARSEPTLKDLAQTLVDEIPKHVEATPAPKRVFIVVKSLEPSEEVGSEDIAPTPWDWRRPLADFLPKVRS